MKKLIISGAVATLLYLVLTFSMRDTSMIWLQTRVFGLLAYALLFIAVVLGELRLISLDKGSFTLFRFHKPAAIASLYLVFLHMASAIMDNFKWGKYIDFFHNLGISFSDKYLVFLSLGTIAFYLMALTGALSAKKSVQLIGYKRWKLTHLATYACFIMAYLHGANLGTDIRSSALSSVIAPLYVITLVIVIALIGVRVLGRATAFTDHAQIALAAALLIVMLLGGLYLAASAARGEQRAMSLGADLEAARAAIYYDDALLRNVTLDTAYLVREIRRARNG